MLKKLSTLIALLCLSTTSFATTNLCENLSGTWTGTGNDPAGLIDSPFPFALQLQYKDGMVYGYTQKVTSKKYVSFGQSTGDYLFFATCKDNTISNSYFVNNTAGTSSPTCGVPNAQPVNLTLKDNLANFPISYENAMTGTLFRVNLSKQTPGSAMDPNLLTQVMQTSHGSINSCS